MIVHSIIVHKPLVEPPRPYTYQPEPIIRLSQDDLDALNKVNGLSSGMFAKYKQSLDVKSLYQVFYICKVVTDVKELSYNYQGKPNTVQIINLGGGGGYIKRWEMGSEFVPLNDEELAAHVTNNDLVLHRVKAYG